jgi:lysozyme family protein
MGASRAHKLLQTALNRAFNLNLVVDGALGNASFGAINALVTLEDRQELLAAYADEAWGFYQEIIRNKPSQKVFERGWKNRAYSLTTADSVK